MTIGIIGTRGIPNNYGGFEQFAEYLSKALVERGHDVSVYSSHNHVYKDEYWNKVRLIHKLNPEKITGTWGQFVYDFLCIADSRKRNFDIILQLGYTSSSVWGWILPRKSVIVSNMDGLEWKRSKYSKPVQRFLKIAERWAVETSDYLIADSLGIQSYLKTTYGKDSEYIAYGTDAFHNPVVAEIDPFKVAASEYNMLIARIEPENNIEIILDGVRASRSPRQFLVVGKHDGNSFGNHLTGKFADEKRIRFLGPIYNIGVLNNLRYYSHLYFHGHSVGGTNPSLLEAMASSALICAHQNEFNNSILGADAFYFSTSQDVSSHLDRQFSKTEYTRELTSNINKVETLFRWSKIIDDSEVFFKSIVHTKRK